jgi:hypothetical protein
MMCFFVIGCLSRLVSLKKKQRIREFIPGDKKTNNDTIKEQPPKPKRLNSHSSRLMPILAASSLTGLKSLSSAGIMLIMSAGSNICLYSL